LLFLSRWSRVRKRTRFKSKLESIVILMIPITNKIMALNVAARDQESLDLLLTVGDLAMQKCPDSVINLILFMKEES
jgi:hypothetical protein